MFTVKVSRLTTEEGAQQTSYYEVRSVQVFEGPNSDRDLKNGVVQAELHMASNETTCITIPRNTLIKDREPGQVVCLIIENMNGKTTEVIR